MFRSGIAAGKRGTCARHGPRISSSREYFAPVLDTPSYISRTGHRWPAGQRADAQERLGASAPVVGSYESRADAAEGRHFIRTWSPVVFWIVVSIAVGVILTMCFALDRRRAIA